MSTQKQIIHALGATIVNQSKYVKMVKQAYARMKLLDKIRLHHTTTDINDVQQIDSDIKFQLDLHYNCTKPIIINLDINNTIDHDSNLITEWSKYITENPAKQVMKELQMPEKPKAFQDEATKQLLLIQNKSRASYAKQRIHNAMEHAHKKGWFVVFDTLTLAPDKVEAFYKDKNAIRNYTRNIGRSVLKSLGKKPSEKYTDHYQYICVPEYGTKKGRLHFHLVHLMQALPKGQRDPNFGRPTNQRDQRILYTFKQWWSYCDPIQHKPLCVRYSGDAYGAKLHWLMPIDMDTRKPIELKPMMAVGHYIAKYINKSSEQDAIKKGLGDTRWNQTLRKTLNYLPTHTWKIRMSRGFGMQSPSMTELPSTVLIQLTKLHWSVTPISKILKHNAKKELKKRMGIITVRELPKLLPVATNLLESLRKLMKGIHPFNQESFGNLMTENLMITGISNHTLAWLTTFGLIRETKIQYKNILGSK